MYQANEKRYETMKYHRCGASGLMLPELSLGLWHNFGDTGVYENMKQMCFTAFDNGITHFDLANNYGPQPGSAEANFGKILREEFSAYRDELIVSTKAGYDMWPGPYGNWGSRKYLIASLDQSLKRLGLDYVDIFYHHRMDPETPLEETMETLAQIVRSGKALYVGISNYDGETMKRAADILEELHCPFIINQNSYNIFNRTIEKNGLKQAAAEKKKGIISFSPLAQGMLTDRYLNGIPKDSRVNTDGRFLHADQFSEERLNSIRSLNAIAVERGESLAQMALKWILRDGIVTSVLIGASRPQQILENLKVLDSASFSEEELKKIDECSLALYSRKLMVVYKTGEQTIYYGRFICLTITRTKIQRILSKLQRLRTMRAAALLWPGIPSTLSDSFCSERKRNVSGVRTKTLSHCRTGVSDRAGHTDFLSGR